MLTFITPDSLLNFLLLFLNYFICCKHPPIYLSSNKHKTDFLLIIFCKSGRFILLSMFHYVLYNTSGLPQFGISPSFAFLIINSILFCILIYIHHQRNEKPYNIDQCINNKFSTIKSTHRVISPTQILLF